ncbi:hypothetical protein PCANC_23353 [Puccinia coronata f. sp. avenae]|uniref:Uncharacterized protein n=1 Tax=Puccinia coronata f. sp. avenae TaxID=200324 RepID=A0A2N5TXP2_9BASI|nr:hypothetical protein PCANC_23353 [Puccinia coronata f. sp. avenae]
MEAQNRQTLLIRCAIALLGLFLLIEMEDKEAYYSNGGQSRLPRFLLEEARPELFRKVTALELHTFESLVEEFRRQGLLEDGRSVRVEEQVLMFLDIVVYNNAMRQTAVKFCRGLYTVQRYFHAVLDALVALYPRYVNLTPPTSLPERLQDPKYAAFKNCLGALDGVLIPVKVPLHQQAPYRTRKGFLAQNVLAVVSFDFKFLFLLAGWEGSAHNGTVLADAFCKKFTILEKKYFLADAGYALQKGLLIPFRATRYHLKEQAAAGLRPATQKELYNLRHSSLRNVVERLFGCLKEKFKILTTPSEHSIEQQVQLVYALATLWNFLRNHQQLDDNQILMDDKAFNNRSDEETNPTPHLRSAVEDASMGSRRARICEKLWSQYQTYLAANPRSH